MDLPSLHRSTVRFLPVEGDAWPRAESLRRMAHSERSGPPRARASRSHMGVRAVTPNTLIQYGTQRTGCMQKGGVQSDNDPKTEG
jgi:hypothetical protein